MHPRSRRDPYHGRVRVSELQPEASSALDAALARAREVVDPADLALAQSTIDCMLGHGPDPSPASDERTADLTAVVEQMLIDVASLDDATALRAARHFPDGGFADFVMASYVIEARTRLRLASDRLLGGAA